MPNTPLKLFQKQLRVAVLECIHSYKKLITDFILNKSAMLKLRKNKKNKKEKKEEKARTEEMKKIRKKDKSQKK